MRIRALRAATAAAILLVIATFMVAVTTEMPTVNDLKIIALLFFPGFVSLYMMKI
ncbi:MAG: hypothetical protein AB201_03445 [Parcubacteria bacterium C7867-006]|nr:MAG: hypothetical protein AB201_03445 [Parcubacteria bacterium C7867-006]